MCSCFSASNLVISLPLILWPTYHFSHHLQSTNHKCTQPCYFSHATQTYSSEVEEDLRFFDEEF
jgi:hypothetical protein